ncbi:hypothetical protein [Ornithinimicrobium sp. INDO-MA30-4]|nr:hypothetical protein [Ornithinimicrobium sp. INDO-MA30-4]
MSQDGMDDYKVIWEAPMRPGTELGTLTGVLLEPRSSVRAVATSR